MSIGRRASATRLARVAVVGAVVAALAVGIPALASAAPPKKTATPSITSSPATWVNVTTASFTITDATAGAVLSCQVDGSAWKTCTSPYALTGVKAGAHTFAVKATAAGYKPSGSASRAWNVDLTAPDAPAVTPATTPTKQTTVSVSFASVATDVVGYQCAVDGGAFSACTSPDLVTGGADGPHTLAVRATDHAGNTSTTSSTTWLQDSTTPKPVINAVPPSVTTSTSATFGFSSGEPGATFQCSQDSAAFTSCTSPVLASGLTAGTHTFQVKATDAVGNTATSDLFSWSVSSSATIVLAWSGSLPAAQTNTTSASFGYTATGQTSLACRLDGGDLPDCTSPVSVTGLADGTHTFDIVADPGTGTQVVLRDTWTVDTVPPATPDVTGPTGYVASTSADLTVTPAQGGDVLTCTLDGAAASCGPAVALSGLAAGAHHYVATASDAAGNTTAATLDWTVDTVAPTATVAVPSQIDQPATVSFNEPVTAVTTGALSLRLSTGAVVAATVSCRDDVSAVVPCTGTAVRSASLLATAPLVPGESYQVLVDPVGAAPLTDRAGNAAVASGKAFRAAVLQQENSKATRMSWRTVRSTLAKGGSYLVEHRVGASASYTFTGTSVVWLTATGRANGVAYVYVDNVRRLVVNNYGAVTKFGVGRAVTGLSAGTHKLTIVVAGKKGSTAGTDTQVVVDAVRVGTVVTVTPVVTTAWRRIVTTAALGGGYSAADLAGQATSLTFRGTGITWYSLRSRGSGLARVYVDGVLKMTVDNYGATAYRVGRTITGLTNARHTISVVLLGTHRKGALGSTVAIDAWLAR